MNDRTENLYDEFLDAAMRGQAEPPEEFLRRHGIEDQDLLHTLRSVHLHAASSQHGDNTQRSSDTEIPDATDRSLGNFGEFRLLRKLGEGGMGIVYLAEQGSLGRRVALKVIRGEVAMSLTGAARFDREARAIARLHHPNIVTVHSVGEASGVRYIAMELIEGRGLDEVLAETSAKGEPMAPTRAIRIVASLARALDYAHSQNVVHRDVKPSNILLTSDDRPMLLDFGLARDLSSRAATLTDAFVGSPYYAAPEQVGRKGEVDARTDVYSLGAVLYECLTGHAPISPGSLEQVLQAILTEDFRPPREINPRVSRNLSVVTMKALERDPARRYPSACAFADDLDAILELRPISARPPTAPERAARWARRNRAATAALLTAAAAAVILAGVFVGQKLAEQAGRRAEINRLLAEAEGYASSIARDRERAMADEAAFETLYRDRLTTYYSTHQDQVIDEAEDRIARDRKGREMGFYTALELAARAERLGAEPARVANLRAELYFQRYLGAELVNDSVEKGMYRELVLAHDVKGEFARRLVGSTSISVRTTPPGAVVHMFRRASAAEHFDDGEPRTVLLPFAGLPPTEVRPDLWCLRVVRGAGEIREGDLIVSINGRRLQDELMQSQSSLETISTSFTTDSRTRETVGEVWTNGSLKTMSLPPGLEARPTAAPTVICEQARAGISPLESVPVESGSYLVVASAEGYETVRMPVTVPRNARSEVVIDLPPRDTTPRGFVYIPPCERCSTPEPFWIMEREVTVREYFEFLNDAQTLARIDSSPEPILYPRDGETARGQRLQDGTFALPDSWEWDWPILLVTWNDATEYAAWRTSRARAAGQYVRFDLPSFEEWLAASAPALGDAYVFGNRFRPKWVKSNFSRPTPDPEPVMRFPIDESVLGVYDLAGSASEWTRSLYRKDQLHYRHAGGSWGTGDPREFQVYGANGMPPSFRRGIVGFRLVMHRSGPPHD